MLTVIFPSNGTENRRKASRVCICKRFQIYETLSIFKHWLWRVWNIADPNAGVSLFIDWRELEEGSFLPMDQLLNSQIARIFSDFA